MTITEPNVTLRLRPTVNPTTRLAGDPTENVWLDAIQASFQGLVGIDTIESAVYSPEHRCIAYASTKRGERVTILEVFASELSAVEFPDGGLGISPEPLYIEAPESEFLTVLDAASRHYYVLASEAGEKSDEALAAVGWSVKNYDLMPDPVRPR